MIEKAINRIIDLSKPTTVLVEGRPYSTDKLHPIHDPLPGVLAINTLTGIQDYIHDNRDCHLFQDIMIHVVSPFQVNVISRLSEHFVQRSTFLVADYTPPKFSYGFWYPLDEFGINLMAKFGETSDRTELLKVLGNVTASAIKTAEDDGITQVVSAKVGIARVAEVPIKNPVVLAPFRTFTEVEQPVSPFIYRLKMDGDKFTASLHEADGGNWQLAAIRNIADWLVNNVGNGITIIA